jgi:WD40 repeat protein
MVFILPSDFQTNSDTTETWAEAYARYTAYLQSVRDKLPAGATNYALGGRQNCGDRDCPHDCWLEEVTFDYQATGKRSEIRSLDIHVRLLGSYHDGYIEFHYSGVHDYSMVGVSEWGYDEIRLTDDGHVLHEIEFDLSSGRRWIIECDDVTYTWKPFEWGEVVEVPSPTPLLTSWKELHHGAGSVSGLAFGPDSERLVVQGMWQRGEWWNLDFRFSTTFWDVTNNSVVNALSYSERLSHLTLSPDRSRLASVRELRNGEAVQVWNVETGKRGSIIRFPGKDDAFQLGELAFSPNNEILATAERGLLRLWGVRSRTLIRALDGRWTASFSWDGTTVASVANNGRNDYDFGDYGKVTLWDVETGREISTLRSPTNTLVQVRFSPDGARIAALGRDFQGPKVGMHLVVVWDVATGKELFTCRTIYDLEMVCWTPDGSLLVGAGGGNPGNYDEVVGWVTLWNGETGEVLENIAAHESPISAIDIAPNGKLMASAGTDDVIRLWHLGSRKLRDG